MTIGFKIKTKQIFEKMQFLNLPFLANFYKITGMSRTIITMIFDKLTTLASVISTLASVISTYAR